MGIYRVFPQRKLISFQCEKYNNYINDRITFIFGNARKTFENARKTFENAQKT